MQPQTADTVQIVEADILDTMNETRELIAQRAYEIYQSRHHVDGFDQDDWIRPEREILPAIEMKHEVEDGTIRLAAKLPEFVAKEIEVIVGHRRAVVCGVHSENTKAPENSRVFSIIELPFDVNPVATRATLRNGTLEITLAR